MLDGDRECDGRCEFARKPRVEVHRKRFRGQIESLVREIDIGWHRLAVEPAGEDYPVKHARFPHCARAEMKLSTEDGNRRSKPSESAPKRTVARPWGPREQFPCGSHHFRRALGGTLMRLGVQG